MKIYTEVNYEFKDGSLVEQSSKFYNYDGQVAECKSSGEDIKKEVTKELETVSTNPAQSKFVNPVKGTQEWLEDHKQLAEDTGVLDMVREGPGGTSKEYIDKIYGGDLKAGIENIQDQYRDTEGRIATALNPLNTSTDVTSSTVEEGTILTTPEEREAVLQQGVVVGEGRKRKFGRTAQITGSEGASILAPNTA